MNGIKHGKKPIANVLAESSTSFINNWFAITSSYILQINLKLAVNIRKREASTLQTER